MQCLETSREHTVLDLSSDTVPARPESPGRCPTNAVVFGDDQSQPLTLDRVLAFTRNRLFSLSSTISRNRKLNDIFPRVPSTEFN